MKPGLRNYFNLGGNLINAFFLLNRFDILLRNVGITAVPKWKNEDQDSKMKAWANSIFEALAPYAAEGIYVNYLADEDKTNKHSAYGEHWKRLSKIKKKWDPENVFRMNHNIPPAE